MTDLNSATIRSKIFDAWHNLPTPSQISDSETGKYLECDQIAQFFSGKRWEEVSWQELCKYKGDRSACLSFMSPDAYRYYLASYMMVALNNYAEADVSADSAWYSLIPPTDSGLNHYWAARVSGFTKDQKNAILLFLQFMLDAHSEDFPFDIAGRREAIQHWKAFI